MGSFNRSLIAVAGLVLFLGCGRSAPVTPPPPPAPVPVAQPVPATLDEAEAARQAGDLEMYERGLRALALSGDAEVRRSSTLRLALHLFDQQRHADAFPALEAAAAANPTIAPYLRLRSIESLERAGRFRDAVSVARAIIASHPGSTAATIARLTLPQNLARLGDEAGVAAAFAEALALPVDESNEDELADMADELDLAGRADLARGVRLRLLHVYPQGRHTEAAYRKLGRLEMAPADKLKLAAALARTFHFDQTLELLEQIANESPALAATPDYLTLRLRSLFSSRNYGQLLSESAGLKLDAPLQLMRARAAWRNDRPQEFLDGLAAIEKASPKSREALEAKVLRAKYYVTDEVDYDKSIANLRAAVDAGHLGGEGENLWNLGWTYVLAGKDDLALETFARYSKALPDGDWRTNSLFWTAKIHDRRGDAAARDAAARTILTTFPFSYYSYRSRELWPHLASTEVPGAAAPFPDVDAELASVADERVSTIRALLDAGLRRDAVREVKLFAAANPSNRGVAFMLADVYVRAGEPFKANGVLQRTFRQYVRHGGSTVPSRFWEILFPLAWWDTIETEAERRKVDPYLIASIIRQESGFEASTVSNAGAVGLMQIMPGEASRIATAAGVELAGRDDLFDPKKNIAVGVAEYLQKLSVMNGNPILAIAAYNAGETAVGRWIAQRPIGDPDLFVESIPYAETRSYVKAVSRNRFEYRRIYEGNTAPDR